VRVVFTDRGRLTMVRRTAGEWVSLIVALVVAGAAISFGIAIVGSFLAFPPPLIIVFIAAGIAAIAVPIFRPPSPKTPAPARPPPPAPPTPPPRTGLSCAGFGHVDAPSLPSPSPMTDVLRLSAARRPRRPAGRQGRDRSDDRKGRHERRTAGRDHHGLRV